MFLVAPNNILTRGSEVSRNLSCYEFDQLSHKIFETFQLDQWDNKAFLQDKDLLLDNSQYKIHIWICPYISRHLLSLNPLLACCRRYSRGER